MKQILLNLYYINLNEVSFNYNYNTRKTVKPTKIYLK